MGQSSFGIILRADDKEITKGFYEKLGMKFSQHKHGDGPLHYACEIKGAVIEIYQGRKQEEQRKDPDYRTAGETTLYIELPPDILIDQLGAEMKIIQVIREHALLVLEDPDGRAVMVAKQEEDDIITG